MMYHYCMVTLTDQQWERIRHHFPEEHAPGAIRVVNRLPPVTFLKLCFGFSIPGLNGICCRSAIRTTKPCIAVFKIGVVKGCYAKFSPPDSSSKGLDESEAH